MALIASLPATIHSSVLKSSSFRLAAQARSRHPGPLFYNEHMIIIVKPASAA